MKNSTFYNFLFSILFFTFSVSAKDFVIEGNNFTDDAIVLSIIDVIPD